MFRIGDFSRIARVSCRLLRYYDELGLLKPSTVERASGYRYYSAAQLPRLNRILVLKELGLTLDEIARVLDNDISAAELRGMLAMRRAQIESALNDEAARLRRVEMRIAQIDAEGQIADDDVIVREEPAHLFLSARHVVGSFAEARERLQEVWACARTLVAPSALGSLTAVAHSAEFEPDRIDIEIGFVVPNDAGRSRRIERTGYQLRELPAQKHMAACVRIGLPEHAHLVTARIGRYLEANGYALAGPSREVFLQPPRFDRMEESVIEMQFPLKHAITERHCP